MQSMIELHPKPDALHGLGLPAIPYPVALPAFQAAVANDGELPLADMLHGLQLRAAAPAADWQRMAPAMARLAELLAADDVSATRVAEGADWWLEIGPVDDCPAVMVLQRGNVVLAAVGPRDDGRLRVAVYRPLDSHAIGMLLALARKYDVPGGSDSHVNWERAQDANCNGANEVGTTTLCWRPGAPAFVGDSSQSTALMEPGEVMRRPACVVAEIGVYEARRAYGKTPSAESPYLT